VTEDDYGPLAAWLGAHLPGASNLRFDDLGKPSSGYSAETTILTARYELDGRERSERFVLRKETPDPPVYPTQVPGLGTEVEIQYRVMDGVACASSVPIAPLYGFEHDPAILGAPFFVMGFVEGRVPIESPMYTVDGFFTELSPASRTAMIDEGLRVLAAIHAIDWKGAGLDWLVPEGATPTAQRQVDVWTAFAARELGGREHAPLETGLRWLAAHLPGEEEPSLCWGDPRLGNMIWRDDRCVCVTDFEAASIAPAKVDLGWWLLFDRWAHEGFDAPRLPGEPTRDEQRARYERHAGHPVGDTSWFEVFAAARYAAIIVRVMNRTAARGQLPSDQTFWRDNSVVTCLKDLLKEVGA
jgi:aminoglycoside phosphotransferase (APT) family kinase protein